MSFDLSAICPDADDAFAAVFLAIGYQVYWDGKRSTKERWYEFYDGDGLAFQISMPPPPIAELVADLPHFIEEKPGIGPTDYWCACEDAGKLRTLLTRLCSAEGVA